ncbi:MAG: hemolysin III family protein [Fibrobacteraceae bacterium]
MSKISKPIPEIPPAKAFKIELANALTHGFGLLFSFASIPVVTGISASGKNIPAIVAAAVYAFSFTMLFVFSTLYHAVQNPIAKRMLKVCDHISIYFLIAGTYTPFLLIYLLNGFGIALLSILWGLAAFGIIFKIFSAGKFKLVSTLIYLAMGWILVVGGKTFFTTLPLDVMILVIVGGGLYTVGAIFYMNKTWAWHHVVWHLFVLVAAICHYAAVLLAVIHAP